MSAQSAEQQREEPCVHCGALIGQPCVTSNGKPAPKSHMSRMEMWWAKAGTYVGIPAGGYRERACR
jgi:hypothetical protein